MLATKEELKKIKESEGLVIGSVFIKESQIERFGGVGVNITKKSGPLAIESPIEGTPAFRAGLKAGDIIMKIDGDPAAGMTITDAGRRLRGKPKTEVVLTIEREGGAGPVDYPIIRDIIACECIEEEKFSGGKKEVKANYLLSMRRSNIPSREEVETDYDYEPEEFKADYEITITPGEEKRFVKNLPEGDYIIHRVTYRTINPGIFGPISDPAFYASTDVHLSVKAKETSYAGKLEIIFPNRIRMGTLYDINVEDEQTNATEALKGEYSDLLPAVEKNLMTLGQKHYNAGNNTIEILRRSRGGAWINLPEMPDFKYDINFNAIFN